uniref:SJCHGC05304 protein n=1 Tax=Schistosoma japonicum TaxID=6182 RepID=Q5DAY4_SCHJA|nr:SJCHGC05304 protein [Schistosoma japonicum]
MLFFSILVPPRPDSPISLCVCCEHKEVIVFFPPSYYFTISLIYFNGEMYLHLYMFSGWHHSVYFLLETNKLKLYYSTPHLQPSPPTKSPLPFNHVCHFCLLAKEKKSIFDEECSVNNGIHSRTFDTSVI